MTQPLRIEHLDEQLHARGTIDAEHALQLRRLIYVTGSVSRKNAEILFKLDAACSSKHPAFAELFVEALTDYFVWQTEPKGDVTPELAGFLVDNVTADGHVESKTELALVLNVVHWSRRCPEQLLALVLEAVRQNVLLSRDTAFGANRPHASIGAADVALLRKALYAPAGDGSLLVTRREADLLFALNEATATGTNDPEWRDFFVRAIGNHLTNPMAAPNIPDRDEAERRERWLNERGSISRLVHGIGEALKRGDVPVRSVFEELDPHGAKAMVKDAQAEDRATRLRLSREAIDPAEAAWLAERILRDGTIDENERALLAFLKKESPAIDPALKAVISRAGL
ncbi:MAG: hypothetical protein ABL996_05185 [Micropepsaceae bacterium]